MKSGEVDYGDCRHECDDEDKSYQEDLAEGDHVQDEHDDHCSASGSGEGLVKFSLTWLVLREFFGLHGVAASSLMGLHDRLSVFCGSACPQK